MSDIRVEDIKVGDEVTLTITGTVVEDDHGTVRMVSGDWTLLLRGALEAASSVTVVQAEPKWQEGDVISLRRAVTHTYMRCLDGSWRAAMGDFYRGDLSAAWREGRVTHLVRDGKPVPHADRGES